MEQERNITLYRAGTNKKPEFKFIRLGKEYKEIDESEFLLISDIRLYYPIGDIDSEKENVSLWKTNLYLESNNRLKVKRHFEFPGIYVVKGKKEDLESLTWEKMLVYKTSKVDTPGFSRLDIPVVNQAILHYLFCTPTITPSRFNFQAELKARCRWYWFNEEEEEKESFKTFSFFDHYKCKKGTFHPDPIVAIATNIAGLIYLPKDLEELQTEFDTLKMNEARSEDEEKKLTELDEDISNVKEIILFAPMVVRCPCIH